MLRHIPIFIMFLSGRGPGRGDDLRPRRGARPFRGPAFLAPGRALSGCSRGRISPPAPNSSVALDAEQCRPYVLCPTCNVLRPTCNGARSVPRPAEDAPSILPEPPPLSTLGSPNGTVDIRTTPKVVVPHILN